MTNRTGAPAATVGSSDDGDARVRPVARVVVLVLAVLYSALVLWVTLRPLPWATEGSEEPLGILDPAAWTQAAAWTEGRPLEILLNVLMFVPIGVAGGLLLRRPWGLLLPLGMTLGIELAQIPLDRISHPRDLVANGIGALIGIVLAQVIRRHPAWASRPSPHSAVSVHDAMSTP